MKLGLGLYQRIRKVWNGVKRVFRQLQPVKPYLKEYRYGHVACVIVQNEAAILEEWVLYHLAAGIEHFMIWDDHSTDNSREILKPYEEAGIVQWLDFPYPRFTVPRQVSTYNKTIKMMMHRARWVWFLDSDEFVVPSQADSIPEVVREIEKDSTIGAIAVNWLLFGTSGVEKLIESEWHIEKLTHRAPEEWKNHRATKGALRPEATLGFIEQPHFPALRKGHKIVYPDLTEFDDKYTHFDILRVHHYWHRTENFYRERKIARKEFLSGRQRSDKELQRHHKAYNQVFDDSIKRFIPRMNELKKIYRS
ncbi:MAG: glycosyltransferase family 2 protein [Owenweeksia sp.]